MNVLLVGNSFSFDICRYIVPMLESTGEQEFQITQAYYGDSSFSLQYDLGKSGKKEFGYNHRTGHQMECDFDNLQNLETIVKSGVWDVVTFQQRAFCAGHEKYDCFEKIRDLVFGWCENKPQIGIIIPWAYSVKCKHEEFKRFRYDQAVMFEMIEADAQNFLIECGEEIDYVIPVGKIIQKARRMFPEPEDYSRDGIHLNENGMVAATGTFLKHVFKTDLGRIGCFPEKMTVSTDMIKIL